MDNQDRAERLLGILEQHYQAADLASSLNDILADARHFAHQNGLTFARHDGMAQMHFEEELFEEEQEDG